MSIVLKIMLRNTPIIPLMVLGVLLGIVGCEGGGIPKIERAINAYPSPASLTLSLSPSGYHDYFVVEWQGAHPASWLALDISSDIPEVNQTYLVPARYQQFRVPFSFGDVTSDVSANLSNTYLHLQVYSQKRELLQESTYNLLVLQDATEDVTEDATKDATQDTSKDITLLN